MAKPPELQRLTVAEAVAKYLRTVRRQVEGHSLSANTAKNYERDLAEFVELAGPATVLDDLSAEDIDDVVLAYGRKPDGRYVRAPRINGEVKTRGEGAQARFRQSISRLFSEAALEGWVQANPMPRTKVRPKMKGLTNVARKALPESSAKSLLTTVAAPADRERRTDQQLGLRDEFLLRLFLESGPRVSEVCRADRADLETRDDGTTWLRVLGKGNKERWLPLSSETVAAYERYVAEERPEPRERTRPVVNPDGTQGWEVVDPVDDAERALALTWRGLRITPQDVQRMVRRKIAQMPPELRRAVTPHGLRHTAATLLLNSGAADISTVRTLLGHASIATTGVYLDHIDAEMARAVKMHPVTGTSRRSPIGSRVHVRHDDDAREQSYDPEGRPASKTEVGLTAEYEQ